MVLAMSLGALAVTSAPVRADAATVPWGPAVAVNGDVLNEAQPNVAYWNGSLYFAQLQTIQAYGTTNITFERCKEVPGFFAPVTCTLPIQANDLSGVAGPVNPSYRPSIAVDASGYIYIAWVKAAGYTGPNLDDVFMSVSTNGGASFLPSVRVNAANDVGSDKGPSIAVTPSGHVWVAYTQTWPSTGTAITLAVSVNQGASFTGYYNVTNQGPGTFKSAPSLVSDGANRLHLVYNEFNLAEGRLVANYTSSLDGQTWSSPTALNAAGWATNPSLVVEGGSTLHVTWWDSRYVGSQYSIHYRASHDAGASWSNDFALNSGTGPAPQLFDSPSVAAFGGTVVVAWNTVQGQPGFGWVASTTDGATWSSDSFYTTGPGLTEVRLTVDTNGTFFTASTYLYSGTDHDTYSVIWAAPPSAPTGVAVKPGTGQLTVSWHAPPQQNVAEYQVWRSTDGSSYNYVATVNASTRAYADAPLANGTYWYEITAVNSFGHAGPNSAAASGTVGATTQQLINQLEAEIAALQAQLSTVQGNASALQKQIADLKGQLNNLQAQQATQTISYANLAFEVIVVVLLVVLLLNQMRKPKAPQLMMAQPAQAPPKAPEDDL